MHTGTYITTQWLRAEGARCDEVTRFAADWPEGAEVTRVNLSRAMRLGYNLAWFAERILTTTTRTKYRRLVLAAGVQCEQSTETAWAEYLHAAAPARAVYLRAAGPALAKSQGFAARVHATAPAWAEYRRATASALAEYERAIAPATMAYKRAIAMILADTLGLP